MRVDRLSVYSVKKTESAFPQNACEGAEHSQCLPVNTWGFMTWLVVASIEDALAGSNQKGPVAYFIPVCNEAQLNVGQRPNLLQC